MVYFEMEDSPMTNARRIMLSLLAGLTVMAAVWAMPAKSAAQAQTPKTMSGKISSIQKAGQGTLQDSFTLDVTEDKTEVFFMVPQTKVTGDFKVGNQADITYGFDKEGNKVASDIKIAGGKPAAPAKPPAAAPKK
jgi:hypothetical protein